jgi:hypothetical protein
MSDKIKFRYIKLYHDTFIEVFPNIYKCGCGVMFEFVYGAQDIICKACDDRDSLVGGLESLSEFAAKTGQIEALKETFQVLSRSLEDSYDLGSEEEFPNYNKVLRVLSPHYFEG